MTIRNVPGRIVRPFLDFRRGFVKDSKRAASEIKSTYDVVVVGGGHNGLISAAYLRKSGLSVCVLERREIVGGAAVTQELVPGFQFSRASYVLSLLRPFIISDLKLKDFGLKFHLREPFSSYTPITQNQWGKFPAKSLLLGSDLKATQKEIAKFSQRDAETYHKYEEQMGRFVQAVVTLLDNPPPQFQSNASLLQLFREMKPLLRAGKSLKPSDLPALHFLLTAPAARVLDHWFESEPLKATLATDALIGTFSGPHTPGTGYVLLHHIMGGVEGKPGAWAYPEGGMGAVTKSIAKSAEAMGVDIFTSQEVSRINYEKLKSGKGHATGVTLQDGRQIVAKIAVLSNATPHLTFRKLVPETEGDALFGKEFMDSIRRIDYTSPVTKINVAVSRLPNFLANPCSSNVVQDHHKCTIHLNCESVPVLEQSYAEAASKGIPSSRPMIELVIPSSLDKTISPEGAHVCLLFTQFTPFSPTNGSWDDPQFKEKYADSVFSVIEEYAPGFKASVVGKEVLTPPDLEKTFGLTGGNIFHGSMSMEQLYWLRPFQTSQCRFPATPVDGLFLCGSGAHPGGGVMGLPGYHAAQVVLNSKK